ncbi:MAG: homocysteine S-methyltransferase family protein [Agathobacter sp.]
MTKQEFKQLLENGPVILDGAMGTGLMKAGMPVDACTEAWAIEHPEVVAHIQKEYIAAGAQILYAPTFGANRIKLAEYGLENQMEVFNEALVALTKNAVEEAASGTENKVYIAGDMTMTGQIPYPVGNVPFETFVETYKEQALVLAAAGVDLFVVETMMSLQECRAAVLAIREVSDLPIMATLTYNEDGRTLYGTPPEVAINVLQSLGVDAVGVNCSTGPEGMIPIVEKMAEYATVPLIAKPNAGLPELDGMETVYRMTPEEFASTGKKLISAGASMVGGCCGTTPAHVKALAEAVKGMELHKPLECRRRVLASERKMVEVQLDGNFLVVGERINPTGKKALQAELREGKLDMVRRFAMEQEAGGAALLDINTGMSGIDELAMTKEVIYEVSSTVDCPLVIDTSHIDVMEEALRIYPGRALINSISLESEKCDAMLALAKKYGAMFILLPLSDKGLPENSAEKLSVLEQIYTKAMEYGLAHEDIVVDGLVTTVGANVAAGVECFETFEYCKNERQLPTICGLSNISFGLPERGTVNGSFLTMAMAKGLTMAIANPCQEQLMNAMFAADMLLHHPNADVNYIEKMNRVSSDEENEWHPIYRDVVKGNGNVILEAVKAELETGAKAEAIINEQLIPAINQVGQYFNDKKYFLPQLIRSANTMKTAIDYLEPLLEKKDNGKVLPTVIIATVKGDIHDIGKNLVVLMMKNYGYPVIDLGKDVPAEVIVETAIRENAAVIGLSALMTTTMMRMQDVVDLCKKRGCRSKIVIGGACITEDFATEIGADAFARDAADTVRVVEKLLNK